MTIANNSVQDGQPHVGNKAVATTLTLTVNLPYVADIVSLYADVSGCELHFKDAVGAAFMIPLIAGTYTPFYGRFKSFFVTNGNAGSAQVAWNAAQTRIVAGDFDDLDGEGISSHAATVVSVA